MKSWYIPLVLIVLVVAAAAYFVGSRPQLNALTQSAVAGEVNVTARYLGDQFEIALDTHSVDLSSFDFSSSILLKTKDQELKAISTSPVSDSSHHRTYLVTFPKFKLPVTLVLNNLGNISQTTLKFERRWVN